MEQYFTKIGTTNCTTMQSHTEVSDGYYTWTKHRPNSMNIYKSFFATICIYTTLLTNNLASAQPSYSLIPNNYEQLPPSERIKSYAKNVKIEDAIGQILIIGFPYDMYNYQKGSEVGTIFNEVCPGGFIINKYNVQSLKNQNASKKDIDRDITNFLNYLQDKNSESYKDYHIPLLIGADFESSRFTSLKDGVQLPPPALTLAATNDASLLELTGELVGYQLSQLGFNALFGPVLEIYDARQGILNQTLLTRAFAGSNPLVYNIASNYIAGIKKYPITIIGKHFPSNGYNNPHKLQIPNISCNANEFSNLFLPFDNFKYILDGVMTSHASFSVINAEGLPASLSKTIITDLLRNSCPITIQSQSVCGFGLDDKLIVSDDLSDMGAIICYMGKTETSYSDIAIKAFDAGHDILLFSHIEVDRQQQRGKNGHFHIKDLCAVRDALIKHIHKNTNAEKHFRESLVRILTVKEKLNRARNPFDKTFPFGAENNAWIFPGTDLTKIPFLKDSNYKSTESFIQKIHDDSTILINKTVDFKLEPKTFQYTFSVAAPTSVINTLKDSELNQYHNIKYIDTDSYQFRDLVRVVESNLKGQQHKLIYFLHNIDDANVIDNAAIHCPELTSQKLVVFLHENPSILTPRSINSATVYGNFSQLDQAYISDVKILLGEIAPKPISNLTINMQGFNDISKNSYEIQAAKLDDKMPQKIWNTPEERKLFEENQRNKSQIGALNRELVDTKQRCVLPVNAVQGDNFISKISKYALKRINKNETTTYYISLIFIIFYIEVFVEFILKLFRTIFKSDEHSKAKITDTFWKPVFYKELYQKFVGAEIIEKLLVARFSFATVALIVLFFM